MQNKKLKIANKYLKQHQDHLRKHLPCSLYSFFSSSEYVKNETVL